MKEPIAGDPAAPLPVHGPLGRLLLTCGKTLSVLGGLLFVGLVIMSIISIVGRKLASAPVPGDMEVLQMVAAAASASFFAYCHMNHGDVKVDFFTANVSPRVNHGLDAVGSLLVACFGALLCWRAGAGALSTLEFGETSAILGWPVGWAQLAMCPGLGLLALSGLYMAVWHLRQIHGGSRGKEVIA
ncbi:TRAP transporter small permease [Ideonella livida]|uniref:TRAP transporter small permease protein n=1 Tax=Ideonella livida TaxID=2707176 RepID=A0A7C9PJI3_9BURK|nr:TRAP transporter small permease [Ideonella livida]NDY93473.1 TRAP transporter small permease [Ideonella livida]